jgi:hypothetical protein
MLKPGRRPGGFGNQVGPRAQRQRDGARSDFRLPGIGRAHGENQFPRIGEVLLVKLQAVNDRRTRGQQVQYFHVESQPPQAKRDGQQ